MILSFFRGKGPKIEGKVKIEKFGDMWEGGRRGKFFGKN